MGFRAKSSIAGALVAFLMAAGPSLAQAADPTVQFTGSGWGHGVGMSQYGAYGMAVDGAGYQEILTHYYQGTTIGTVDPGTKLWVNLVQDFGNLTLTVLNAGSQPGASVSIQSESGNWNADPGAKIDVAPAGTDGCSLVVTNPSQSPVTIEDPTDCSFDFTWYDWSTPGTPPTTKIQIDGCSLADWNPPGGTISRPCQYARGQLHLRHGSGGLDLSAEMLLDDYVLGISEMPYAWSSEALKAQAVAARTYALSRKIARGDPTSTDDNGCWCHVRDTTADQRYVGWGHGTSSWVSASNSTAGQVVKYGGSVITAFYSSSSGGATEYGHLKGFSSTPVEWLSSVDDHWAVDGTVNNPNASWSVGLSPETVAAKAGLDALTSVVVTERRLGSNSVSKVELRGILGGQDVTLVKTGSWVRINLGLKSEYFTVGYVVDRSGDEILLYRNDGTFQYSSLLADGRMGALIHGGSNYTKNWKSITSLDLDGDGQDEIMFYRDDGLYRYYEIGANGYVGSPLQAGDEYTRGWDSITSVDLDGDGQDEIFFYRDDGLYRYYNIKPNGQIGAPIKAGDEYTRNWDSITAVDLDGDGRDEMFFYRKDGLYRFYDVRPDGSIGSPIKAGDEYTRNWDSITAVDLDGDGQDEMFFYRKDGLYRFYNVRPDGTLGSPIRSGSDFTSNWSVVTPINLDGE